MDDLEIGRADRDRIDAHQHFWKYDPARDSWITEEMSVIRRDFLPEHLASECTANGIDSTIAVQADQSENETLFLLELAEKNPGIAGVVGWVDLQSPAVEERLAYYKRFLKMKGFRHILQGEKDRALMLKPAFKRGIAALRSFGFTYDVLIFPDQLGYARDFTAAFPDQPFVIDHVAKPYIKDRRLTAEWQAAIRTVAAQENVYCKISGMVTEADWKNWKPEELHPYIDTVVEAFGPKRILFGSDWPVCLVAASYDAWYGLLKEFFTGFSKTEQEAFFGGNAIQFYNL